MFIKASVNHKIFFLILLITVTSTAIFAQQTFVLSEDITIAAGWTPIGTSSNKFSGKFYGNGHTITITGKPAGGIANVGFFGYTDGNAVIRDVKIVYAFSDKISCSTFGGAVANATGTTQIINVIVEGSATIETSGTNSVDAVVGGVVGNVANTVHIANCRSALNISVTNTSYKIAVGGAIGKYDGAGTPGNIDGIAAVGTINVVQKASYDVYFGGAAGYVDSAGGSMNNVTSSVALTFDKGYLGGGNYVGGVVGRFDNTDMDTAKFSGSLSIASGYASSGRLYIGGITGSIGEYTSSFIGSNYGNITKAKATGGITVRGSGSGDIFAGGLIGYMQGLDSTHRAELTESEYSAGSVWAETAGDGEQYVGGCVGYADTFSYATKCKSLAEGVTALKTAAVGDTYTGYIYVGGFAGYSTLFDVSMCSSTADVTIPAQNQNASRIYAGGFLGSLYDTSDTGGSITTCYATGNVTVSSPGKELWAGGLVGRSYGDTGNPDHAPNTIARCYATGDVKMAHSGSVSTASLYCGGLVGGAVVTTITDSYTLGNVIVEKPYTATATICAGGIQGSGSTTITHCFAQGSVSIKAAGSNSTLRAGGIVGGGGTISNCAAIGNAVTIQGTATQRTLGRVFGSGTGTNNYAFGGVITWFQGTQSFDTTQGMFLGVGPGFYSEPTKVKLEATGTTEAPPDSATEPTGATTNHGADAVRATSTTVTPAPGLLCKQAFWTGLDFTDAKDGTETIWDTANGITRSYPLLLGLPE